MGKVTEIYVIMLLGIDDGQTTYTVTIVSSPAGISVNGSTDTFDYPILINVTLTCNVTSNDGSSLAVTHTSVMLL